METDDYISSDHSDSSYEEDSDNNADQLSDGSDEQSSGNGSYSDESYVAMNQENILGNYRMHENDDNW